jgi:hypothetical protein
VYDGTVLRPREPRAFDEVPMNVPLEIVLEGPRLEPGASLRVFASLDLDGPTDGAEHFDKYLQAVRHESEL